MRQKCPGDGLGHLGRPNLFLAIAMLGTLIALALSGKY